MCKGFYCENKDINISEGEIFFCDYSIFIRVFARYTQFLLRHPRLDFI